MIKSEDVHWGIVYDALIHAVKTNSGIGFYNQDQGHPAYLAGAEDGSRDQGDSPQENELYKMFVILSEKYGRLKQTPVSNWRQFCQLAVDGYTRAKGTHVK